MRDGWSPGLGTLPVGWPEEHPVGASCRRETGRESSGSLPPELLMLVRWHRDTVCPVRQRGLGQRPGG